ncbi:MAG TPA: hypothetical protein VKH81_21360 [Candidatus Angelobacter sp.]|nr:hypothetical protein [Candidatus Angelobacter sp.]
MKNRFFTFDYVLWLSIIVCQFLACWAIVKRRSFYRNWKPFSYYLFYMATSAVVMLGISQFGSRTQFIVGYSILDFLEAILLNLVVLDILVKVLDPFESLPGRTVARFCFWAIFGISTAVAVSVMMPAGHNEAYIQVLLTIERTIFLADASLLWILLMQSKALGVTWKSSVAEIAIGFVLYLTVQATTRFVAAIYQSPKLLSLVSEVGQAAYLIAVLSWIWTITHRDPIPAPPSPEALARVSKLSADDEIVPKERIFAAVGIKINRPGDEEVDEQEQSHSGVEI